MKSITSIFGDIINLSRCKGTFLRISTYFVALLLLSTICAQAGVVKSKGVKRILDTPHGEVVVDSVLDDGSGHLEGAPAQVSGSTVVAPKNKMPTSAPTVDTSTIEYPATPEVEETPQIPEKSSGSPWGPIAVGLLVVVIGVGVVALVNKRKEGE